MKTVGKSATIPESRLSKQIATNDDAAANEEEVEGQIEEDNVEKAARENRSGVPTLLMSNKQIEAVDDAVATREEVEEQVERKRVEKKAFENRISAASAEKWTRNGRMRG
jgi:hypothetical protein